MPISITALARHGRAQIAHLPVYCRAAAKGLVPAGPVFQASFDSAQGDLLVVDGGLIYDRGGTLMVSRADWPITLTEEEIVEIAMSGAFVNVEGVWIEQVPATWRKFNIENVSGEENPNNTEILLTIGPPNG